MIDNQLEVCIKKYDLLKIKTLEETSDKQYLYLKNAFDLIKIKSEYNIGLYIFMILQNALISYQLSGTGEERWLEFSKQLTKYINSGGTFDNTSWWKSFLGNCKNNCRLNNIKFNRIKKTMLLAEYLKDQICIKQFFENMEILLNLLSKSLNQKSDKKTIVFAVKMFGYASRIAFDYFVPYPKNIHIPLDSRLTKIYQSVHKKIGTENQMKAYFMKLSNKFKIPPLHLDSILWIDYWYNYLV